MLKKINSNYSILSLWIVLLMVSFGANTTKATPEIQGIYGMDSTGDEAWLAIKVLIPESQALSSILWYNNDGGVIFPSVRVGTGHVNSPGLIADFMEVADHVQGATSDWSEVVFTEPIASSLGSLYVAFAFPMGEVLSESGIGGGPGVGYLGANEGCPGWLSGEGEIWARLHEDYSFAVQPVFVPVEEGMAVKCLGDDQKDIPDMVAANYFNASPNPFNPETNFNFGLVKAGDVSIDIYDLKGRKVNQVQNGYMAAGHHTIGWQGRDSAGRGVSSGVYFVRLVGEGFELNQKILLVK